MPRPLLSFASVVAAGLIGVTLGIAATVELTAPAQIYNRFSYHARTTLGLEKNWVHLPSPEQAAGRDEQACPPPGDALVLVVGGQSNAANVVPTPYRAGADVSVWFNGRCYGAADPLLGTSGGQGSLWSVLADRLAQDVSQPVMLIVVSVAGTQFADWMDPRSGYYDAMMARVGTARDAGYAPDMILWHQGETDAQASRDMAQLRTTVSGFFDRMTADVPDTPVYLFQATRCTGAYRANGVPQVAEVLRTVAQADPDLIVGMNTDVLEREYRWDNCHFNSVGREAIVAQVLPDLVSRLSAASE